LDSIGILLDAWGRLKDEEVDEAGEFGLDDNLCSRNIFR
jgi:hypothetical protein